MANKLYSKSIPLPAPLMAGSCDPIDPRILVESKSDLTTNAANTFGTIGEYCKVYEGLTVYVSDEKSSYMYIGPAVEGNGILLSEVLKESNWRKLPTSESLSEELDSKVDKSELKTVEGKSLLGKGNIEMPVASVSQKGFLSQDDYKRLLDTLVHYYEIYSEGKPSRYSQLGNAIFPVVLNMESPSVLKYKTPSIYDLSRYTHGLAFIYTDNEAEFKLILCIESDEYVTNIFLLNYADNTYTGYQEINNSTAISKGAIHSNKLFDLTKSATSDEIKEALSDSYGVYPTLDDFNFCYTHNLGLREYMMQSTTAAIGYSGSGFIITYIGLTNPQSIVYACTITINVTEDGIYSVLMSGTKTAIMDYTPAIDELSEHVTTLYNRKPSWDDILNKPSTYTPSSHTHSIDNVNGLLSLLSNKVSSLEYFADKTLIFETLAGTAPKNHTHTTSLITNFPTFKTINGQPITGTGNISIDLTLYKVVSSLPTSNIDSSKIYLILSEESEELNIYIEYIYVNNKWELLGTYKTSIDLSNYIDTDTFNNKVTELNLNISNLDTTKVDKIPGKGLSSNDFTDEYKNKLGNLVKPYNEDISWVLDETSLLGTEVINIIELWNNGAHLYMKDDTGKECKVYLTDGYFTSDYPQHITLIVPWDVSSDATASYQYIQLSNNDGDGNYSVLSEFITIPRQSQIDGILNDLNNKVDKISGKSLSTNDYTTAEKNKLNDIEAGAQKNTVTSVSGKTGSVSLTKTDVGLSNVDNTSDLNKPISTATLNALNNIENAFSELNTNVSQQLMNKVTVESGKGLSTNDFTNELKLKLDGIKCIDVSYLLEYNDGDSIDHSIMLSLLEEINNGAKLYIKNKGTADSEDTISPVIVRNSTEVGAHNNGSLSLEINLSSPEEPLVFMYITLTVNTYFNGHINILRYSVMENLEGPFSLIESLLENKVDKVEGKGLSTNDFTNEFKLIVESATLSSDLSYLWDYNSGDLIELIIVDNLWQEVKKGYKLYVRLGGLYSPVTVASSDFSEDGSCTYLQLNTDVLPYTEKYAIWSFTITLDNGKYILTYDTFMLATTESVNELGLSLNNPWDTPIL